MDRHSFMAANVALTSPRYELGKVAFSSMFPWRKNFGASSFSKFHHTRQKIPFATPRTVLQRAKKTFCNRSQFRTLFLPHRFIKIRPSHQRPVSIEFLTICWIPEFSKSEQNRKSCGNVRIWRKRAAVRRKNHRNLNKSFGMNLTAQNVHLYELRLVFLKIESLLGVRNDQMLEVPSIKFISKVSFGVGRNPWISGGGSNFVKKLAVPRESQNRYIILVSINLGSDSNSRISQENHKEPERVWPGFKIRAVARGGVSS